MYQILHTKVFIPTRDFLNRDKIIENYLVRTYIFPKK